MIDRNDTHGAPPACRVLVVDDDRVHRAYARCVFEAFGCDVGLAVDGLEAIRLARETAFDIILMDRRMPRCDGDAAARRIRETPGPSQKALILCHDQEGPYGPAATLYDRFLMKPVTTYDISDLIPNGMRPRRFQVDLKAVRRQAA